MTPLWIWGLGRYFLGDNPHVEIPVQNVFYSLAAVVIPVAIGVLITHCKPKAGEFISRGLKPFSAVIGIVFFSLGIAVYYYALRRVTWRLVVACLVLSGGGYLLGFTVGKLVVKDTKKAVTISLETGFQNLSLSLFILTVSLQPPESDLAGVIPIFYTFIGAGYPVIAFIIYKIVQCRERKKKHEVAPEVEAGDTPRTLNGDLRSNPMLNGDVRKEPTETETETKTPRPVSQESTKKGENGPANQSAEELDHPWVVKVDETETHALCPQAWHKGRAETAL